MARSWIIDIPVRPKAVQSVRATRNGFFPDPKVRKWKETIRPYIKACCQGEPTRLPLRIRRLVYVFAYPASAKKHIVNYLSAGGKIPYIGTADITDNLSKGLVDVCAGLVFENDKQIWRMCEVEKVYGTADGIHIEFEETPNVVMIDGRLGSGEPIPRDSLF